MHQVEPSHRLRGINMFAKVLDSRKSEIYLPRSGAISGLLREDGRAACVTCMGLEQEGKVFTKTHEPFPIVSLVGETSSGTRVSTESTGLT